MQGKEEYSEETPDCLNIGCDEDADPWFWIETICDMVSCAYRDGCKFYREFIFDGDEIEDCLKEIKRTEEP